MLKNLKQKLAIILVAVLASTVVAAVQSGNTAHATANCSLTFTGDEKTKIQGLKLDELEACEKKVAEKIEETDGNEKTVLIATQKYLNTAIDAKKIHAPIDEYIKSDAFNITDISNDANQCLKKADNNKITVIIEEPLDIGESNPAESKTEIRSCTRNTVCVRRIDNEDFECVSYLNKKGSDEKKAFCSPDAAAQMQSKNTADKTVVTLHCSPVQVLLSTSGTDMLFTYIGAIYTWAASITGIIAVLIVVISGIQISAAAGDQQAVTNAKNRIFQALGGLALLFLSGIILYTINPTFFTAG